MKLKARSAVTLKKSHSNFLILNEQGALSVLTSGLITVLAVAAIGSVQTLRSLRRVVENQFQADQCTSSTALRITALHNRVSNLNLAIEGLRAGIALLQPGLPFTAPAIAPLKTALTATFMAQEALLTQWKVEQAKWLTLQGCAGVRSVGSGPLPSWIWTRPLIDSLGPQPLSLSPQSAPRLIWLKVGTRTSVVRLEEKSERRTQTSEALKAGLSLGAKIPSFARNAVSVQWRPRWESASGAILRIR